MGVIIMPKILTDEFLIDELHRFVRENGRVPTIRLMDTTKGYPSVQAYKNHFKTFNNALEVAELEINNKHLVVKLDGTETCSYCGCTRDETSGWRYDENNIRFCDKHGHGGKPDYVTGNLDKNSEVGKGFVSQRVVAKVLGLELKYDCNYSDGFDHPYDLYDKGRYNYINVKSACLNNDNAWHFGFTQKEIPDTYILVGFDEDRKNVIHVWITDPLDDLTYEKKSISITNTLYGLKRAKPWEVDNKPYNDVLYNMDLDKCKYLKKK